MECRIVVNSLSDLLDGREKWLSDNEVRDIEMHLADCSGCRSSRLELAEIKTAARELPLHTPPKSLWIRVSNEIESEIKSSNATTKFDHEINGLWGWLKSRKFSVTAPQLAGAGAVALLAVVIGVSSMTSKTPIGGLNFSGMQTAILLPGELEIKAEIDKKLTTINERKNNWDPQIRTEFEGHLTRIENSIGNCRSILQANKEDQVQQQMLRALYDEKNQLLEDIERLKW